MKAEKEGIIIVEQNQSFQTINYYGNLYKKKLIKTYMEMLQKTLINLQFSA